jgi:hypothetical protein
MEVAADRDEDDLGPAIAREHDDLREVRGVGVQDHVIRPSDLLRREGRARALPARDGLGRPPRKQ